MKKTSKPIKLLLLNSCLKTGRLVLICLFLFKNSISQNLINNGSFEYYGIGPGTSGCVTNFDSLKNWKVANNSPDVYVTSCTFTNHYGIPNNSMGVSYPLNGNAYTGAILFSNIGAKEYFYQHLSVPLKADSIYCLSFFVSRADRITHAIKNIGAYFSSTPPPQITSLGYINAMPQVVNTNGFITDTIGWTEIHGCFKAQGGEQYITLGNFNSNANTDTLFVGSTNPVSFADGYGYYYIDSVSLYDSLHYAIITNLQNNKSKINFTIYPNPAKNKVRVIINASTPLSMTNIKITDVLGRDVKELEYEEEIDISALEKGIYFISILQEGKLLVIKKFIKE